MTSDDVCRERENDLRTRIRPPHSSTWGRGSTANDTPQRAGLLPLAPQVSQLGNAALIEREAVTVPLDNAFGFEIADVGSAAIEVQALMPGH